MADIVDLILEHHQSLRDEFGTLVTIEAVEDVALLTAWTRLAHRLETHARAEEAFLYPVVFHGAAGTIDEHAMDTARDHNRIRQAVFATEQAVVSSPEWWEALLSCRSRCDEHLAQEETTILPEARSRLNDEQRRELGDRWIEYIKNHAEGVEGPE